MKAKHGEPMKYLLAHMRDGCCYPWPFAKQVLDIRISISAAS